MSTDTSLDFRARRSPLRPRRRRSARAFWRRWLPRLDLRGPGGPGLRERLAAITFGDGTMP